jgi:hypothetical protein
VSGVEIATMAFANILKHTPVHPIGSHLLFTLILPEASWQVWSVSFSHQDCSTGHCRDLHPLCGEIFGFERFQEVVRDSGALTADVLLEETAAQVAAFVKGVPPHDNLTVIVVAVDKNAGEKQEAHPEAEKGKSGELQIYITRLEIQVRREPHEE